MFDGGRQGLSEAQRYPADYHGILSGAPAINWPASRRAAGAAGDARSEALRSDVQARSSDRSGGRGVRRDRWSERRRPRGSAPLYFDPKALVGTLPNACDAITEADASVIRKIWEGPKRRDGSLWYGLPRGAGFALSATGGTPLTARPSGITLDWFKYFLTQNPQWDWSTLSWASYEQLWDQSVEQFGPVFGTDNPNLAAFKGSRRQAAPLARLGRSIDLRRGDDRLFLARPAGDGRPTKDLGIHPAVHGARRRALQWRHGSCTSPAVRLVGRVGRAGGGA